MSEILFRYMSSFIVLCMILQGCNDRATPCPLFTKGIAALGNWTHSGWNRMSFRDEEVALDSIARAIRAESTREQRNILYGIYTNTLVNVPFFSETGICKIKELPRGWYQPPYFEQIRAYQHLVGRTKEKFDFMTKYDFFCLDIEVWKRLQKERSVCRKNIEFWVKEKYEKCPSWFSDDDIAKVESCLCDRMKEIEQSLESYYRSESEESRRAYDLFRQVVGREASPRYARRARERVDRRKCER